jgi:hypothetical protein
MVRVAFGIATDSSISSARRDAERGWSLTDRAALWSNLTDE